MTKPKLANLALWGAANAYAEGRAYRHPHTGEQFPSVTTILKNVDKSGLSQWAADQAILWAVENWQLLGGRSDEGAFNAGRYRWRDVRDERAEVGDGIHATVEALHKGLWDFPTLDEEQMQIMHHWDLLCAEHTIEPIFSEFTVFDSVRGVMGTADGLWHITCLHDVPTCLGQAEGESFVTLVDVKTSRRVWPEHSYQLAGLWAADEWLLEVEDMTWKAEPAWKIDRVAIIHLRADSHAIVPVEDLDLNSAIFGSYIGLWYAKQSLKDRVKSREVEAKKDLLGAGFSNLAMIGGK